MKRLTHISLLAAATYGIASMAGAATPSPTTADYLDKAGASDLYEKTSSQLVLKSTKNAAIKRDANMMIKDHTKSTAMLKTAAKKEGITPKPPMLDAKKQSDVDALKAAKGEERDRLYVEQQKAAHQEALTLHQTYAQSGDAPALKSTAGQIVPVVQHHIEMFNQTPAM